MAKGDDHVRQSLNIPLPERLPDPISLDAVSARRLRARVRRHWVPQVVEGLRGGEAGGSDETALLESRFVELERYARRLDGLLADSPLPAHLAPLGLTQGESDGETYASCAGRMFCCPLSLFFVHGPIAIRAAIEVAQRILRPGEHLTGVAEASWRKPIISEVLLEIRATEEDHLEPAPSTAFGGRLRTSHGRVLSFSAAPTPCPVVEEAGANTLTFDLFCGGFGQLGAGGPWRFDLGAAEPGTRNAMNAAPAIAAMTLVDALAAAMVNVRSAIGSSRQALLVGLRDLPLPARSGDRIGTRSALELSERRDEQRVTRSGAELVPVDYRFTGLQDAFSQATFAEADLPYRRLLKRV